MLVVFIKIAMTISNKNTIVLVVHSAANLDPRALPNFEILIQNSLYILKKSIWFLLD